MLIREDDLPCIRETPSIEICEGKKLVSDRRSTEKHFEQIRKSRTNWNILFQDLKKHFLKKKLYGGNISQSYFSPFNAKEIVSPRNKVGMLSELKCKDWQYNVKTIAQ